MDTSKTTYSFSLFLFFIFFSFPHLAESSSGICLSSVCRPNEPKIHFPFRLLNLQPKSCGFPGFTLFCDANQTLLNTTSGQFNVQGIDYATQDIWINDPNNCLAQRLLSLNLSSALASPFRAVYNQKFRIFNCSISNTPPGLNTIGCLSGETYNVIATSAMSVVEKMLPVCKLASIVRVPVDSPYYGEVESSDLSEHLRLTWDEPSCGECAMRGGRCGFKSNSSLAIGCFDVPQHGLPRTARYAITVGVGVPALMCLVGLVCFVFGRVKSYGSRSRINTEMLSSMNPHLEVIVGLDKPTIDSYPKVVLGESCRLPKPDDNTCPICLSEYKPKDTLRSIPECKHCFHAECIDEWLLLNVTCPVCRQSPDQSPRINS